MRQNTLSVLRFLAGLFNPIAAIAVVLATLIYHPNTLLPRTWNPIHPLYPDDPLSGMTGYKLAKAIADGQSCKAALDRSAARFQSLPDKIASDQCHIKDRVRLEKLSTARINGLETRCEMALRLYMWEKHGLQPIAQEMFNSNITRVTHSGSYSCRPIRTTRGNSTRMSQHATANAIDISGVRIETGKRIPLLGNWDKPTPEAQFMQRARDAGCDWFRLTLGPDYNSLHADHFHFDQGRWGRCR